MKMSDVFKLPMVCDDGDGFIYSKDLRHSIQFDDSDAHMMDHKKAVTHAINNHDRMADEIAELRESEVKLVNETEDLKCEVEGLLELIRKNSQVFKFLSGKDNETLGAITEKLQAFDAHLVNEALLDKYK